MIFDKNGMMDQRVQHHNASGTKEQKVDHWNKRTEKEMTTSPTVEFEKHPCKQGLNGVGEN